MDLQPWDWIIRLKSTTIFNQWAVGSTVRQSGLVSAFGSDIDRMHGFRSRRCLGHARTCPRPCQAHHHLSQSGLGGIDWTSRFRRWGIFTTRPISEIHLFHFILRLDRPPCDPETLTLSKFCVPAAANFNLTTFGRLGLYVVLRSFRGRKAQDEASVDRAFQGGSRRWSSQNHLVTPAAPRKLWIISWFQGVWVSLFPLTSRVILEFSGRERLEPLARNATEFFPVPRGTSGTGARLSKRQVPAPCRSASHLSILSRAFVRVHLRSL